MKLASIPTTWIFQVKNGSMYGGWGGGGGGKGEWVWPQNARNGMMLFPRTSIVNIFQGRMPQSHRDHVYWDT